MLEVCHRYIGVGISDMYHDDYISSFQFFSLTVLEH